MGRGIHLLVYETISGGRCPVRVEDYAVRVACLIPPSGMAGGEPGKGGRNDVLRTDGTMEELGFA
jgi:hypothetical protein